ncbi:E3 ubiquitin-protein ligase ZSWIM2 [Strongylocentrotus purpuratus]|uniref:RING-type E3 ubiquitin transferase n=1 Tax=Strongylocentrotus purpuratus TaxID=7668 RepID=A0A7M7NGZ8_STRPU|nr:E3 ubiquitin-protein ligase ZSWIM2 [Strongylocentrotus purpuratus]
MAIRSVPWQRSVSDAVSWHQDQALSATIYILRETGPTGFLLKEEGESKKVKVLLGDPHKCTCSVFKKEKEPCKHICWVLLKKFRLDRNNELSYQRGFVEREINDVLRGLAKKEDPRRRAVAARIARNAAKGDTTYHHTDGKEALQQREITEEDVCPICQDELLGNREPVTYCRFGCAKSIHIKCMKVWADHQKSTGETVLKCPLCREDFGQIDTLEAEYRNAALQKTRAEHADIHMGKSCDACNQSPISGKCYKCTGCTDLFLCQNCFVSNIHSQHSFQFRQKSNQRWRPAQRGSGGALPSAVMSDLENRDITDEDYDTLLQLDNAASNQMSNVPEHVVKSFHVETVRDGSNLLSLGTQCRVCLRAYAMGQLVKKLPCRHKFHAECIDQWLLHEHPTCPIDGTVVWNPITAQTRQSKKTKKANQGNEDGTQGEVPSLGLQIGPGAGVVRLQGRDAAGRQKGRPGHGQDRNPTDIGLTADFQLTGSSFISKPILPNRSTPDRHRGLPSQHSDPTDSALLQRLHSHEDTIDSSSPSSYQPSSQRIVNTGDFNAGPTNQKGVVIRHRPPARPLTLDRNRTHVSSIPLQREEANMTPVGGHHGSSNASPLSIPRLPVENGVSSPHESVRERGRLGQKTAEVNRRRARSLGIGRNRSSSRERSHLQPDNKPQSAESLFLGSTSGQLIGSSKSPSSNGVGSGHHPRSKVKPLLTNHRHPSSSRDHSVDLALAGNAMNSLNLHGFND